MFNFKDCKQIVAVDNKTGDQYIIGTTKVLDGYGNIKIEYSNYTFEIFKIGMSRFTGLYFTICRCRETIGNEASMELIFR